MSAPSPVAPGHWRRYRVLYLVIAIALAPLVAALFAYYVAPPAGRTNYGTLIEPQRPVPLIHSRRPDGSTFDLRALKGQWVFVMVDRSACDEHCRSKLFHMRQLRTMTGKERDAIERVWFITDDLPLDPALGRDFDGTVFVRADARDLAAWLQLPAGAHADLRDHIWLVDPLGNLMLRWPRSPDPKGTKSDIARLLRASSMWTRIERPKD